MVAVAVGVAHAVVPVSAFWLALAATVVTFPSIMFVTGSWQLPGARRRSFVEEESELRKRVQAAHRQPLGTCVEVAHGLYAIGLGENAEERPAHPSDVEG